MNQTPKAVGHETLDRIAGALSRYNTWMFEQISPFVGGRVLEVGSGIGNLSQFLISSHRVYLSDVSETYLEILKQRFGNADHVTVISWDLNTDPPSAIAEGLLDTVICLNVLEHIEDDAAALRRMRRLLAPGGKLILLVPAHPFLFNGFDRALDHFRRYQRQDLATLLQQTGFRVEKQWLFNALGALGWFVNGHLLRKTLLPGNQMELFDRLVPILKLERFIGPPFGTSVIAIAEIAAPSP